MILDVWYKKVYTYFMKTAISIPDGVFESAENLAHRMRCSRSALYVTALKRYIKEHRNDRVTERLDEVYGETGSTVPDVLQRMQTRSLPQEKW